MRPGAVSLLLLAAGPLLAADPPAPAAPPAETVLPVRVWLGLDRSAARDGEPVIALDVAAEQVRCTDGSGATRAVTVGVWRHEVLEACRDRDRPPAAAPPAGGKVIGRTQPRAPGTTIRCSADDWRCAASP